MAICKSLRVCGTMPANQFNKQAASMRQHLRGPMFTHTKGAFVMRDLQHCTMLWHGCKNSNVHFGTSCVIMGLLQTSYKATAARAGNAERLSIPEPAKEV